ncbi:hypothetical protein KUTeg_000949 [Tegillarca granosa]|uniref:Impact N-terminal domain-containing protein n=1 Tax=Tegillarca granosa TaxID=220873 RepID=A0ABQ9FW63_TEGGR|nr:hypothetical protein KUTeg_000949 [Tegillarca granosa]
MLEILESESESETDDLTVIEKDVADTPPKLSKKKLHVAVKKNFTKAAQTRHTWSKNEKIALECQFQKNINLEKVPCKLECLNAIKNQSCLARFTWKHIKYAVKNLITSRRSRVGTKLNSAINSVIGADFLLVFNQAKLDNGGETFCLKHILFYHIELQHQGYDDDGEFGAGSKLLKLLKDNKHDNVLVVVSRYAGDKLGPQRFNHLTTAGNAAFTSL